MYETMRFHPEGTSLGTNGWNTILHAVLAPHLILSEKIFQRETLTYRGLQVCHLTLAGKSLKGNIGAWSALHLDESATPPTLVHVGHFLGNMLASRQSARRDEVTQQRSGQPKGQRMRVELKAAGQMRSLAWITEAAIITSQREYPWETQQKILFWETQQKKCGVQIVHLSQEDKDNRWQLFQPHRLSNVPVGALST